MESLQQIKKLKKYFTITRTIEFVSLIIINEHDQLLVSQRTNPTKPMYLHYQCVGEKIEQKESRVQTLSRELLEETGIILENLQPTQSYYIQTNVYKGKGYDPNNPNQKIKRIVHLY